MAEITSVPNIRQLQCCVVMSLLCSSRMGLKMIMLGRSMPSRPYYAIDSASAKKNGVIGLPSHSLRWRSSRYGTLLHHVTEQSYVVNCEYYVRGWRRSPKRGKAVDW